MERSIEIGDYVGILEGTEKGFVTRIEKNKAWIETDDGFEITSLLTKLVKYPSKKKPKSINPDKPGPKKEVKDEFPESKKPVIKKVKDKDFRIHPALIGEGKKITSKKHEDKVWEVDLHIEEIIDHYKHLTNGEIVDIQLKHARSVIDKARIHKIGKVVFIHGKGKGTLRQELLNLLSGYTFLEFYDASFKEYGGGATEVRIFVSKV